MSKPRREAVGSKKALKVAVTPCNTAANSLDVSASLDLDDIPVDKEILTPQKVAEHLSRTAQPGNECAIIRMPDTIMLHILGFLSVRDLCRAACVCRRLNHLVRQKPLWRHVDLSPFRINLVNVRKLAFAYFSDSLRSLQLSGFLRSFKNTECISDALLIELGKRSPKLEELCIVEANLAGINSSNLPLGLSVLKLLKCNYPTFWLSEANKQGKLDSLQHLDLSGSNGFGVRDVECLTPKPLSSLVTLRLSGCYRVGHRGASRIAETCPGLLELNLKGIPLSNQALQKIGSGLSQLKTLNLSECTNCDNVFFDVHHLAPLKHLEELHITDNDQISGDVLVGLVNSLPSLQCLRASRNGNLTQDHVGRMKNVCVMPRGKEESSSVWELRFYPQDKLKHLAQQQSSR